MRYEYFPAVDDKITVGGVALDAKSLEECSNLSHKLDALGYTWSPSDEYSCTTVVGSSVWTHKRGCRSFLAKPKEMRVKNSFDGPRILLEVILLSLVCYYSYTKIF